MQINSDKVRTTCNNCNKCTTTVTLRLGIFGIPLCSSCLKELGEIAQYRANQMRGFKLPEPISSVCNDLSNQNVKNQQLQAENELFRSVLKDAYMEANSEFTEETKTLAEKLIGPLLTRSVK